MRNDSLKRIGERLAKAKSVYLYPHENPDGDAIGSCAAICSMLRSMGIKSYVFVDGPLPDNLTFMEKMGRSTEGGDMFVTGTDGFDVPEISMCVDCGSPKRFPNRKDFFLKAGFSICIDHHISDSAFCDMNHIVPGAAATGELVFDLMKAMKHTPSKEEGEAIFAAITTDSGNFQYSNTTKKTHRIVCSLYDLGIDVARVSAELYQNVPKCKLELESRVIENMKIVGDGKVAYSCITQDLLKECGARMSDADSIVATVRSVKGVEIAILFKERTNGDIFVSMRAKTDANVQQIAVKFGGGGHRKAAGATVKGKSLDEVIGEVTKIAIESLN